MDRFGQREPLSENNLGYDKGRMKKMKKEEKLDREFIGYAGGLGALGWFIWHKEGQASV